MFLKSLSVESEDCGGFEEKSAATRSREAKKAKVEQTIKNGAKSGEMVAAKLDNLELEIKVAMVFFEEPEL